MQKIRQQEEKHIELLNAAKKAKNKLDEFAPDITSFENGMWWTNACYGTDCEWSVSFNHRMHIAQTDCNHSTDHSAQCDIVTVDIVEQLITEIGKIKTQLNNTELQLYEANEKMADIIENVRKKIYPLRESRTYVFNLLT